MQIYLAKDGNRTGPYSDEQVQSMIAAQQASLDDLAWRDGLAEWQPLRTLLASPPSPSPSTQPSPAPDPMTPTVVGPTGVGGWLLFFCVSLTILRPLAALVGMVNGWKEAQAAFSVLPGLKNAVIFENIGMVAIIAYAFVTGFQIWRGHPRGRELAKNFLLISLAVYIGVEIIALLMMIGLPPEVAVSGAVGVIGTIVPQIIYFLIWWFYFKKSVRVRNTYGPRAH